MKLSTEPNESTYAILNVDTDFITIRKMSIVENEHSVRTRHYQDNRYEQSVLVFPHGSPVHLDTYLSPLVAPNPNTGADLLGRCLLEPEFDSNFFLKLIGDGIIIKDCTEILLIGTGTMHKQVPISTLSPLIKAKIGYEVMSNSAAARTFSILSSEGRKVAALFLIGNNKTTNT